MYTLKLSLQHRLNPLHIYCRLTPFLGRRKALAFSKRYEVLYAMIPWDGRLAV